MHTVNVNIQSCIHWSYADSCLPAEDGKTFVDVLTGHSHGWDLSWCCWWLVWLWQDRSMCLCEYVWKRERVRKTLPDCGTPWTQGIHRPTEAFLPFFLACACHCVSVCALDCVIVHACTTRWWLRREPIPDGAVSCPQASQVFLSKWRPLTDTFHPGSIWATMR